MFDPDKGDGPMINPVKFHRAALTLQGFPPYVNTERVRIGGGTIRISSGSEIDELDLNAAKKSIAFKLRDPLLGYSFLFIAGGGRPANVAVNGRALPETEDPDAIEAGWRMTDLNGVYVKTPNDAIATVEIVFP
jgi:hypothetical protein